MLNDELKSSLLRDIETLGSSEHKETELIIAGESQQNEIISFAAGLARIRNTNKFKLILGQPAGLLKLSNFEIRCCLCHKVISYPAWYYEVKLNVNWFNFFVCFDSAEPRRVTARCYRK